MGYKEAKANAAWLLDRREGNSSRAVELYRDMAKVGMGEVISHSCSVPLFRYLLWDALSELVSCSQAELRLGDYAWSAQNFQEAISHWRIAAEKGVGQANYNLGYAYEYGIGVVQEP